jgi:hypothetical protein
MSPPFNQLSHSYQIGVGLTPLLAAAEENVDIGNHIYVINDDGTFHKSLELLTEM